MSPCVAADDSGVGEVLKEMPNDQVTDSLKKLCYLQVQPLNQVSFLIIIHCMVCSTYVIELVS